MNRSKKKTTPSNIFHLVVVVISVKYAFKAKESSFTATARLLLLKVYFITREKENTLAYLSSSSSATHKLCFRKIFDFNMRMMCMWMRGCVVRVSWVQQVHLNYCICGAGTLTLEVASYPYQF